MFNLLISGFNRLSEIGDQLAKLVRSAAACASFFGCGLFLLASQSYGLGLGDIKHSSFLDQPLEAVIAINQPRQDYLPEEVKVRSVGPREARDLGIELASAFYRFQLTPKLISGKLAVDVKSLDPIREPFVNILVELKWPTGTVYREYTLLVDPQTIAAVASTDESSATSEAKPPSTALGSRSSQPRANADVSGVQSDQALPQLDIGETRYRVKTGDVLSRIAQRLKPDGVSRQAMTDWLFANNPDAFRQANINRLIAGAELKIPADSGEILPSQSASPAQASVEQTQSAAKAPPASRPAAVDRLTVVTPQATQSSTIDATLQTMSNQMVAANEVIDSLRRENEAMRRRLQALEKSDYEESLQRLVALKDQELNQLKAQLAEQENASKQTESEVINGEQFSKGVAEASPNRSATVNLTAQTLWMLALLVVTSLGALFFFLRWRSEADKPKWILEEEKSPDLPIEEALSEDLSDEAIENKVIENNGQKSSDRQQTEKDLSTTLLSHKSDADNELKERIQAKTESYIPAELAEHDRYYHDQYDDLISEAISSAKRGFFQTSLLILRSEIEALQEQPGGKNAEIRARLELALHYVESLQVDHA